MTAFFACFLTEQNFALLGELLIVQGGLYYYLPARATTGWLLLRRDATRRDATNENPSQGGRREGGI